MANLGSRVQISQYAKTRLAPILHQFIEDALIAKPSDPVAFLETYVAENSEALRKKVSTTFIKSLSEADAEDGVSHETSELLRTIDKLECDKEALKRIGRTEISRLKTERDALIAKLGGEVPTPEVAVAPAAPSPAGASESPQPSKTDEIFAATHSKCVQEGLSASHFLGEGLEGLNAGQKQCLVDAWSKLADSLRPEKEVPEPEKEAVSAPREPTPPAQEGSAAVEAEVAEAKSPGEPEAEAVETAAENAPAAEEPPAAAATPAALSIPDEAAFATSMGESYSSKPAELEVTEQVWEEHGRSLAQATSGDGPFAFVVGLHGREHLIESTAKALGAGGIPVGVHIFPAEGADYPSSLLECKNHQEGEETFEDGPLLAQWRAAAKGTAEGMQWVVLTGDTSMTFIEQLRRTVEVDKGVQIPGGEDVPLLPKLKFVVATEEAENVPYVPAPE